MSYFGGLVLLHHEPLVGIRILAYAYDRYTIVSYLVAL